MSGDQCSITWYELTQIILVRSSYSSKLTILQSMMWLLSKKMDPFNRMERSLLNEVFGMRIGPNNKWWQLLSFRKLRCILCNCLQKIRILSFPFFVKYQNNQFFEFFCYLFIIWKIGFPKKTCASVKSRKRGNRKRTFVGAREKKKPTSIM